MRAPVREGDAAAVPGPQRPRSPGSPAPVRGRTAPGQGSREPQARLLEESVAASRLPARDLARGGRDRAATRVEPQSGGFGPRLGWHWERPIFLM